jgi:hypothetical protein
VPAVDSMAHHENVGHIPVPCVTHRKLTGLHYSASLLFSKNIFCVIWLLVGLEIHPFVAI